MNSGVLATFTDYNKCSMLNGTIGNDILELKLTSVVILFNLKYFENEAFEIRNCFVLEVK